MIGTGVTRPCTRSQDEGSGSITPFAPRAPPPAFFPHAPEHRTGFIGPVSVSHGRRAEQPRRLLAVPGTGARFKSP